MTAQGLTLCFGLALMRAVSAWVPLTLLWGAVEQRHRCSSWSQGLALGGSKTDALPRAECCDIGTPM